MENNIVTIYFSPTSTTEKVVKIAEKVWNEHVFRRIDLCENIEAINLANNELAIIGVPSYGGRVPAIALERLSRIYAKGTKAIILTSYGNRAYDDTLLELQAICKKQGFQVIAAIAAVCEHSIVYKYGKGRPDASDQKELEAFYQTVHDDLLRDDLISVDLINHEPWREYNGVPLVPQTANNCIACGLCASKCPVFAIDIRDPRKTDSQKCISCMRCVAICPQSARSIPQENVDAIAKKIEKACMERKNNELFTRKK